MVEDTQRRRKIVENGPFRIPTADCVIEHSEPMGHLDYQRLKRIVIQLDTLQ